MKTSAERSFGYVFTVFFTLVALGPLRRGESLRSWALVLAAAILLVALGKPGLLEIPNRLWLKLGHIMGAIMSPIIITIFYCVAIVPIGLVLKILRKDILSLRYDPKASSYWIPRNDKPVPDSMKNQF
jgi:ABC-type Co2+ transport system permease subunit